MLTRGSGDVARFRRLPSRLRPWVLRRLDHALKAIEAVGENQATIERIAEGAAVRCGAGRHEP